MIASEKQRKLHHILYILCMSLGGPTQGMTGRYLEDSGIPLNQIIHHTSINVYIYIICSFFICFLQTFTRFKPKKRSALKKNQKIDSPSYI